MSKEKSSMPMSTAGLVRYYEDSEKAIHIRPEHVVGACIAIIIGEIALKLAFAL